MINYSNEPVINVGIMCEKVIHFELHGDFKVAGQNKNFSGRFSAELIEGKIICKQEEQKLEFNSEVIFKPQDFEIESFLLKDVTIGVKFHWEKKEKERFTGSLKLLKENDKITAINILPAENYLVSVISSEMSAKSPLQLLKTHAIISRSWLIAQIEKSRSARKAVSFDKKEKDKYKIPVPAEEEHIKWYDRDEHKLFDVCADDHCQRYQGVTKVFTDSAWQAVKQTAGIVLVSGDKICDTRYSKSCGGITESFENVWEPVKYNYLSSVIDYKFTLENYNLDFSVEANAVKWIKSSPQSFCNTMDKKILSHVLVDFDQATRDFFRWHVEYTQEEITSIINSKSGIDLGLIKDLIPVERGYSSRLIKLKIIGTKKIIVIGKELEIRRILSDTHLYSSAFVVDKIDVQNGIPQKFILTGAGWGHGVGLCQIGAAVMASKGYQFDEILLHYFKNARLKKIY